MFPSHTAEKEEIRIDSLLPINSYHSKLSGEHEHSEVNETKKFANRWANKSMRMRNEV